MKDRERAGSANSNWRGGKTKHPLYSIYLDMVSRCHRPTHARYAMYGARGIAVCARWRNDFWAFVEDMGPRPAGTGPTGRSLYSMDRVNNDGPYEPGNTRWTTAAVQSTNRRQEHYRTGAAKRPQNNLREFCKRGHSLADGYVNARGHRSCRTCKRLREAGTL